jgi:hypothetical protein
MPSLPAPVAEPTARSSPEGSPVADPPSTGRRHRRARAEGLAHQAGPPGAAATYRCDHVPECAGGASQSVGWSTHLWTNGPVSATVWMGTDIPSRSAAPHRSPRHRAPGRERTTPAGGESGGRHHGPTRGGGAGAGYMRPAWWLQVHRVPEGPFSKPKGPTVIDHCQQPAVSLSLLMPRTGRADRC